MDLLYELRIIDEYIWSTGGVAVGRTNSKYLEKSAGKLKSFPFQNIYDAPEIDPGPLPCVLRLS
jgi:hypothetical protein